MSTNLSETSEAGAAEARPDARAQENETKPWFRLFAFHGGGLDAVMQLGIAHALLLAEGRMEGTRPLEMISGISGGAINAVALAEILQAGSSLTGKARLAAQMARFLDFLEGYRNAPATVLNSILPDPYETAYRQALKAIELPRHFQEERKLRDHSIATRTGVIKLLNSFLRMRVRMKSIVLAVRIGLGFTAAKEMPWLARWFTRIRLAGRGWWLLFKNTPVLSLPAGRLVWIILTQMARRLFCASASPQDTGTDAETIMFNASTKWNVLWAVLAWLLGFVLLVLSLLLILCVLLLLPATVAAIVWYCVKGTIPWPLAVGVGIGLCVLFFALVPKGGGGGGNISRWVRDRVMENYHILSDVGDSHALLTVLVRLFDPDYFGKFHLDAGIDRALRHEKEAPPGKSAKPCLLSSYAACAERPIFVAPLAANVRRGRIEALPQHVPVVDALMAASAVVPFYRAQFIRDEDSSKKIIDEKTSGEKGEWYIDGVNVGNDPVTESLSALRGDRRALEEIATRCCGVRIYSLPLLPMDATSLPGQEEPYTRLVDVGLRALQLQKFQDALLEKNLAKTYAAAMPAQAVFFVEQPDGRKLSFFRTDIVRLTPPRPLGLNTRIPGAANNEERRALMEETVAEGCRALLERLLSKEENVIEGSLRAAARALDPAIRQRHADGNAYVPCRALFSGENGALSPLPGSDDGRRKKEDASPGVPEVCRRCSIACGTGADAPILHRHLQLPDDLAATPAPAPPPPAPENSHPESNDPAVAFVFSGGVFRGVFQVGFANAVSELGLFPDVVAGASVGTIIGALVGRVLSGDDIAERRFQSQRLASTFLAIDQFVMTDRFADFIRRFSIRAASADFSVRDADLTLRRYDKDSTEEFGPRLRRVVAGLERIFYINPFELRDFVQTARMQDNKNLWAQFKNFVQEWFDRYGVGLELLGPEPLKMLIDGILFDDDEKSSASAGFDCFAGEDRKHPFQLIGTTTNLTRGRLELLRYENEACLTEGLLASSAFPAVFRPRWSWEVFASPTEPAQYCDGGVLDNLPLDSVVGYLADRRGEKGPRFARRPAVPHLILAASLEPEPEDFNEIEPDEIDRRCGSWLDLRRRASELAYNGKIDKFAGTQAHIRRILEARINERGFNPGDPHLPLNLEVVVVKAKWLCSTFAFHPMLGYRRADQAASIAHGCASTFWRLAELFHAPKKDGESDGAWQERMALAEKRRAWGERKNIAYQQLAASREPRKLTAAQHKAGVCWYRRPPESGGNAEPEPLCPFSAAVVEKRRLNDKVPDDATRREKMALELNAIYEACGRPETHARSYPDADARE